MMEERTAELITALTALSYVSDRASRDAAKLLETTGDVALKKRVRALGGTLSLLVIQSRDILLTLMEMESGE